MSVKKSYLVEFVKTHSNWAELLSAHPYNIKIKAEGNLYLFKYNAYASDFTLPEVQEARGIIIRIDNDSITVACWPFRKFANYGESYADKIDWSSARVTEKIDGSIIKVWYNKGTQQWQVSTDSVIDASNAEVRTFSEATKMISFKDLFTKASENKLDYNKLDKDKTYIFELVTPDNQVVVRHETYDIYHIGTRNNITGMESIDDIGIKQPKSYNLSSLEDCITFAKSIPENTKERQFCRDVTFEGLVVNDKDYNRIKVKSHDYVVMHGLMSDKISKEDVMRLILSGDAEEVASYCLSSKEKIMFYLNGFNKLLAKYESIRKHALLINEKCSSRKEFAGKWREIQGDSYGYAVVDGVLPAEYIGRMPISKLVKLIENPD